MNNLWTFLIKGPLLIIDTINNFFNLFNLKILFELMFGFDIEDNNPIMKIPYFFIGFVIVFFLLILIIFAINFINEMIIDHNFNLAIKKSIFNSAKIIILLPLIPIIFIFISLISYGISELLPLIFKFDFHTNLATKLYYIGSEINFSTISSNNPNFNIPSNINSYNLFLETITVLTVLIMQLILFAGIIKNIVELFFLFIISPIILALSINSRMQRLSKFKNEVIDKAIKILINLISYYLFIYNFIFFSDFIKSNLNYLNIQTINIIGGVFIIGISLGSINFKLIMQKILFNQETIFFKNKKYSKKNLKVKNEIKSVYKNNKVNDQKEINYKSFYNTRINNNNLRGSAKYIQKWVNKNE